MIPWEGKTPLNVGQTSMTMIFTLYLIDTDEVHNPLYRYVRRITYFSLDSIRGFPRVPENQKRHSPFKMNERRRRLRFWPSSFPLWPRSP
jgi:hypothetical protein